MPTYNFKSNKTGKEWEDTMSWKKLDEYYVEHDCQQIFHSMQNVVSGTGDVQSIWSQTDDGFQRSYERDYIRLAGSKSQMYKGTSR